MFSFERDLAGEVLGRERVIGRKAIDTLTKESTTRASMMSNGFGTPAEFARSKGGRNARVLQDAGWQMADGRPGRGRPNTAVTADRTTQLSQQSTQLESRDRAHSSRREEESSSRAVVAGS